MKKIAPYIFIIILLVGFFSVPADVSAQRGTANWGVCTITVLVDDLPGETKGTNTYASTEEACKLNKEIPGKKTVTWIKDSTATTTLPTETPEQRCIRESIDSGGDSSGCKNTGNTPLYNNVPSCFRLLTGDVMKCVVSISYYIFYVVPAALLGLAALFFNATLVLGMSNFMYGEVGSTTDFVTKAWTIVRDLSNMFFILILLYIAIRTILGLGGHDTKKMIAGVIVATLLINFSMFLTKVVIDASNVLALVFYNKVDVRVKGVDRPYSKFFDPIDSRLEEKDLSGGIAHVFDPTKQLTPEFFEKAKKNLGISKIGVAGAATAGAVVGGPLGAVVGGLVYLAINAASSAVPDGLMLTIILVSGAVMVLAAYAFFTAGLAFVSRMLQLWVLVIFSPFAVMSSAMPQLEGIKGVGWKDWLHQLLTASFMAPIFMFMIYLIFLLVQTPIFESMVSDDLNTFQSLLLMVLKAVIVLMILMKATSFAKESSGKLGSIMIGTGKAVLGLALGATAIGGAVVGRKLIGGTAKSIQQDQSVRDKDMALGTNVKKAWGLKGLDRINPLAWGRAMKETTGAVTKLTTAGIASGIHKIPAGGGKTWGQKAQEAEKLQQHKSHAEHELNDKAQSKFGHNYSGKETKYSDLTDPEKDDVRKEIDMDAISMSVYKKKFDGLTDATERKEVSDMYEGKGSWDMAVGGAGPQRAIVDEKTGKTTRVDNAPTATTPLPLGEKTKSDFYAEVAEVKASLGELSRIMRTGTYDVRNLPDLKFKSKGGLAMTAGFTAAVAAGIRMGLKKGAGVDPGTGGKDAMKDLGDVIKSSLAYMKIDISSGGGGGSSAGGSHGEGGGGHH